MKRDDRASGFLARFREHSEKVAAVLLIGLVLGGLLYLLNRSNPPDLGTMQHAFWFLLGPAWLTLLLTGGSYFSGMGIGFLLGWMRTSRNKVAGLTASTYIEAIRGTPLFVQLLFLFSLFSFYNPGDLPTEARLVLTGFVALMVNTSAYQAEIFRGGFQSVSGGQVEAARSIGLSYWGSMRSVILPQAIRIVVPPMTNEFLLLLKGSALLFFIGVPELTDQGRFLTRVGGNFVEVYLVMTALYLLMTLPLAKFVGWLERRYRIPGLGLVAEPDTRRAKRGRSTTARVLGLEPRGRTGRGKPALALSPEAS